MKEITEVRNNRSNPWAEYTIIRNTQSLNSNIGKIVHVYRTLSFNEIETSFTILRILQRTTKISKELRAMEKIEGSSTSRFSRRRRERE